MSLPRTRSRSRTRSRVLVLSTGLALAVSAGLASVSFGGAAVAATGRTETALTPDPKTPDVVATEVTIPAPLPASFGAHPAACDTLSYLRYRSASGPSSSAAADRILLTEPGALAGASSLDQIARHTVEDAAAQGRHIEFWALDRRANCLEDNSGLNAAVAAKDPSIALDYYTRGASVNGRKFAGYVPDSQLGWLTHMGMQQTVKDEYTLETTELPDPAVRSSKVWCGGHSLGGVVTAFYSMSDFDGNPATLADAGYNQCAGYFALDTQISTSIGGGDEPPEPANMAATVSLGRTAVDAAYSAGILPKSLNIPVVNPETINLLALAGAYAKTAPTGVSPLPSAFHGNDNVTLALKFLLSKDLGSFISGIPDITKVKITNQATLGALMDDNSSPISIIQESVGFFTGGKVVDKSFPTGNDLLGIDQLKGITAFATGTQKKAIPDDVGPIWAPGTGPLYSWLNYDQIAGAKIPTSTVDGKPFTTAASEVTDIDDLATGLSAYPLDFTEHYFPLAMMTDTALWGSGDHSVVPTAIHPEGPKAHPVVSLLGSEGVVAPQLAGKTLPPNTLVLNGYQHLDVLTAAAKQNDGTPEKGAAYLSSFVLSH